MSYTRVDDFFPSANGHSKIKYYIYNPIEEARAVLLISHGMFDYTLKYEKFIKFMTENKIAVLSIDYLGHGMTAGKKERFGYFAKNNGDKCLVADFCTLSKIATGMYADLPKYILGQDIGAIIARNYLVDYENSIDGALFIGTLEGDIYYDARNFYLNIAILFNGKKHKSDFLNTILIKNLSGKYYNQGDRFSWLTSNEKVLKNYRVNPLMNYSYSNGAIKDMMKLSQKSSSKIWYQKAPQIPYFLLCGENDCIGNYQNATKRVNNKLKKLKNPSVEIKIYETARHELLLEPCQSLVYNDILVWINKQLKRK